MSKENKLVREELLAEESIEKIGQTLEADVVAFTEEISGKTDEELAQAEKDLMEEFKANDELLKKAEYDLPDSIDYDGKSYKRGDLTTIIVQFLNKLEVEFRATLGIYQAIRFWKTVGTGKIPYAAFDSTLRLLGTLKFKGESECRDILVINNWFTSAHDAYSRDNIWTQYIHARHNAIMQTRDKLKQETDQNEVASDTNV